MTDAQEAEAQDIEERIGYLDPEDPGDQGEIRLLQTRLAELRGTQPPPMPESHVAMMAAYARHLDQDPAALKRFAEHMELHREAVREGGYHKGVERRRVARLVRRSELAIARVPSVCQGVQPRSSIGSRRSRGTVRRPSSDRASPGGDPDEHDPALARVPAFILEALRRQGLTDRQIVRWLIRFAADELERADRDWHRPEA